MEQGHVDWSFGNFVTMNYGFSLKTSKFDKRAGWNKGVQVGKFSKFKKVCCTIIRETKVPLSPLINHLNQDLLQ